MTASLSVFYGSRLVGALQRGDGTGFGFTYARSWLDWPEAFAISVSLPLAERAFGAEAEAFFTNLLPEGDVRELLCRQLGLSVGNAFDLLAAIGGECAGALSVQPEGAHRAADETYREISPNELLSLAQRGGALATLDGRSGLRLSLAGAQDKLPVRLEGDRILLPEGSAPSTHILKLESRHFKHLPANEAFMLMLAVELGIPAPAVELRRAGRHALYLVERFDRRQSADGTIQRLHQEDFCQVLAVPPSRKYEQEGGPGFADCHRVVMAHSGQPVGDAVRLVRWLSFNVVALNTDGHAKNLALLSERGTRTLAPAFDLVCTRIYESLDRSLAMKVGGERDPTLLLARHWQALAAELGAAPSWLQEQVRSVAEGMAPALRATGRLFKDRFGDSPALALVTQKIRKQATRVLRQLDRA